MKELPLGKAAAARGYIQSATAGKHRVAMADDQTRMDSGGHCSRIGRQPEKILEFVGCFAANFEQAREFIRVIRDAHSLNAGVCGEIG